MNPHPDLTAQVIRGLGWLYLLLCAMNIVWTFRLSKQKASVSSLAGWAFYCTGLALVGLVHITKFADPQSSWWFVMPQAIKTQIDGLANPVIFFAISTLLFIAMIVLRDGGRSPLCRGFC